MSADVVAFPGASTIDTPPDKILEGAKGKLVECLVIGTDAEGEFYLASHSSYLPDVLWLIKQAEHMVYELSERE